MERGGDEGRSARNGRERWERKTTLLEKRADEKKWLCKNSRIAFLFSVMHDTARILKNFYLMAKWRGRVRVVDFKA